MLSIVAGFVARYQFLLYPALVHLSVMLGEPHWGTVLLPLFFAANARPFSGTPSARRRKSAILLVLGLIAVWSVLQRGHWVLYLPPALIVAAIMAPFVMSVRPGYTPLITRIHRLAPSNPSNGLRSEAEICRYTDRLTWIWIALMGLILLDTVLLALLAPVEVWSLFTNVINYGLLLALIAGEWLFRMFWMRAWISPVKLVRTLLTVDHRELMR
ncbi:MAG: hypothetical protein R3E87_14015 [Burkholderiaceae bacterium]